MNEREAVARLQAGDIDGLEALVEAYQARAVHVAVLITADRALAEDVVQNAFLRVYQRIAQFDTARPFGPWFFKIVANDARKAAARGAGRVSLDGDEVDLPGIGPGLAELLPDTLAELPEDAAERAALRDRLRETLDRLTPDQRALVVMRYFLDSSEAEMAHDLDIPPSTVKWRLHAARAKLRTWLRPLWERR